VTTLPNSNTAMLVIDAQNVILKDCYQRDLKVSNISKAIDYFRQNNTPVIWIQHSDSDIAQGSPEWEIVPELKPAPGEEFVYKHYRSSFVDTNLHEILQTMQIGQLVVAGAESNNCIRHTIHSALDLGYDVTLLGDAHTAVSFEWDGIAVDAEKVIDEQNLNFMNYQLPGRSAKVVRVSDLKL
jgi:nicotinamidase-related amidase